MNIDTGPECHSTVILSLENSRRINQSINGLPKSKFKISFFYYSNPAFDVQVSNMYKEKNYALNIYNFLFQVK